VFKYADPIFNNPADTLLINLIRYASKGKNSILPMITHWLSVWNVIISFSFEAVVVLIYTFLAFLCFNFINLHLILKADN